MGSDSLSAGKLNVRAGSTWRILAGGVVVALAAAALIMTWLMRPPLSELATLIRTLAITSIISLGLGFVAYRAGLTRSPSLRLSLTLSYVLAALLIFVNVLVMAEQMFFSPHDLALSIVLLIFALIIATAFGFFVAAAVTDGLRQLSGAAQEIAAGKLAARAPVSGRDEVAQLAVAFNEMAAQLQTAEQQRDELDVLRRDLIAWTSHDLRTPLTSIRALVEALHDGLVTDPDTVQRYYRTIRADVVAMNDLINDLFELAQLNAGGLVLEFSDHSLSDLISDALESFRPIAARKGITVEGEVAAGVDPVMINAAKISRVLANLINNALQHVPAGGCIWVRTRRSAAGVTVSVQDNGPGIPDVDLPRIFEKFYRGEQARSRATGGAGLGLAIAHAIVEAHGGRMWAENAPSGGAMVSFLLPDDPVSRPELPGKNIGRRSV